MTFWHNFLDSLDTPGGHIAVLVFLVVLGVGLVQFDIAKGEDVLVGAFAALLAMLRGTSSNHNRQNGKDHAAEA
ncbi:MAG TPA: hypothetical protein VEA16_08400 [Vicinamibacterales bacterium]|nr:hypothetical protein [Vicinamibacterales bacterium]